jgi:Bacterial type II and III secretion system protein
MPAMAHELGRFRHDPVRTARWSVLLVLLAVQAAPVAVAAQGGGQVRVSVEFRQTTEQSRDAVQGGGSVIITERGSVRPRAGMGAESAQRRVRRSSGIFTLVQDGGESTLTVASRIPVQQIAFYHDQATGAGHVTTGVTFRDVGTSLRAQARLLPGNQVRVRLTPRISYVAADGTGIVEFTEAATELVVPSGRPVVLAGSTTETHAVLRQLLGVGRERAAGETTVVLTATAQ